MFAADEENPDCIQCTSFDLARLDECEIGEEVASETGTWKACRDKNDWTFIENVGKFRIMAFKNLISLKNYLIG